MKFYALLISFIISAVMLLPMAVCAEETSDIDYADGENMHEDLVYNDILTYVYNEDSTEITIEGAYESCTEAEIPAEIDGVPVTSIADYAFDCCTALTSVTVPESVIYIGNSAFSSCKSLSSLTLPDTVTHIGDEAFAGCTALSDINIPGAIEYIGADAFRNTAFIDSVSDDYVSFITGVLYKYKGSAESVTISDGYTHIMKNAFADASSLKEIIIPASVTEIGENAFPENIIIIGESGSPAQVYAEKFSLTFKDINQPETTPETTPYISDFEGSELPAQPVDRKYAALLITAVITGVAGLAFILYAVRL